MPCAPKISIATAAGSSGCSIQVGRVLPVVIAIAEAHPHPPAHQHDRIAQFWLRIGDRPTVTDQRDVLAVLKRGHRNQFDAAVAGAVAGRRGENQAVGVALEQHRSAVAAGHAHRQRNGKVGLQAADTTGDHFHRRDRPDRHGASCATSAWKNRRSRQKPQPRWRAPPASRAK